MDMHRNPRPQRRERFQTSMMSNGGESQAVARISVKDRLGPLPNAGREVRSSFKRRNRSVERNHRRGRKVAKSAQQGPAEETNLPDNNSPKTRIPVHERLGLLPPSQSSFKKSDQFFHKRNRQQVWRHQDYHEAAAAQQSSEPGIPTVEENAKFVNPRVVPAVPRVQPFDAEQHRQTWTWVRPTGNSSAMDIDESIEKP